jgi:hypothetical protein
MSSKANHKRQDDLKSKTVVDLRKLASVRGITGQSTMNKEQLVKSLRRITVKGGGNDDDDDLVEIGTIYGEPRFILKSNNDVTSVFIDDSKDDGNIRVEMSDNTTLNISREKMNEFNTSKNENEDDEQEQQQAKRQQAKQNQQVQQQAKRQQAKKNQQVQQQSKQQQAKQ